MLLAVSIIFAIFLCLSACPALHAVKVPLDEGADAQLQRFALFPRYPPPLDISMRRAAASERLITRSFIVGLLVRFREIFLVHLVGLDVGGLESRVPRERIDGIIARDAVAVADFLA